MVAASARSVAVATPRKATIRSTIDRSTQPANAATNPSASAAAYPASAAASSGSSAGLAGSATPSMLSHVDEPVRPRR